MAHIINQASKIIIRVHIPFLFNMLPTQSDFPHQILNQPIKKCEGITLHLESRNTKMPSLTLVFQRSKEYFRKKDILDQKPQNHLPPNPQSHVLLSISTL